MRHGSGKRAAKRSPPILYTLIFLFLLNCIPQDTAYAELCPGVSVACIFTQRKSLAVLWGGPRKGAGISRFARAAFIDQRVFKVGIPIRLCVVIRNENLVAAEVPAGGLVVTLRGEHTTFEPGRIVFDEPIKIAPRSTRCIEFDLDPMHPKWNIAGFEMVGDRITASAGGVSFSFAVDEFGIPEWLRTANAVGLGPLGGKASPPYKLYDLEAAQRILDDLVRAGITAVFIGPEYYSYGMLEGGLGKYDVGEIEALLLSHPVSKEIEALLLSHPVGRREIKYWFPTGPEPGKEYDYLTPPYRSLSDQVGIKEVRAFIDSCRKRKIKVIGYADPWGVYCPDTEVTEAESACDAQMKSNPALSKEKIGDASWVRLSSDGTPVRLEYVDNILPYQKLHTNNYAVYPAFWPKAGATDAPPQRELSLSNPENPHSAVQMSDYRSYIASQLGLLANPEVYGLDGIFIDDVGRPIQSGCNICFPLWGDPPELYYSCKDFKSWFYNIALAGVFPKLWIETLGELCPLPPSDCWEQFISGCDPMESIYCSPGGFSFPDHVTSVDDRNRFIRGAAGTFLRYCRTYIKEWGGDDKALLSSDYYVPYGALAVNEDLSSTDLYDPLSKHQAKWYRRTVEKAYRPVRMDFNPRSNTSSEETQLVQVAAAWANRAVFWFAGDKKNLPINCILEKFYIEGENYNAFSESWFGRYSAFYNQHRDRLTNPLLEQCYHSMIPAEVNTIRPSIPEELYVTAYFKPSRNGPEYIAFHLIRAREPKKRGPAEWSFQTRGLGVVEAVEKISPYDYEYLLRNQKRIGTDFITSELTRFPQLRDGSAGYFKLHGDGRVTIHLNDLQTYAVVFAKLTHRLAGPEIVRTEPVRGERDVHPDVTIRAFFDRPIDGSTIHDNTVSVTCGGEPVAGRVTYNEDSWCASFIPREALLLDRRYEVTVSKTVESLDGLAMDTDYRWTFFTEFTKKWQWISAAGAVYSNMGNSDVTGWFAHCSMRRGRWGYGGHIADLEWSENGNVYLRGVGFHVGYSVLHDEELPYYERPDGTGTVVYGTTMQILAGFKALYTQQARYERWMKRGSGNLYEYIDEPRIETLWSPVIGLGTTRISSRRISLSTIYLIPVSGGQWAFDVESFNGVRILPHLSMCTTVGVMSYPENTHWTIGLGVCVTGW